MERNDPSWNSEDVTKAKIISFFLKKEVPFWFEAASQFIYAKIKEKNGELHVPMKES